MVKKYEEVTVALFCGIRSTNGKADVGMMSRPGRKVPCGTDGVSA